MEKKSIDKDFVNTLKPGEKDQLTWDGGLPGFGVKITPKGKIVYVVQYRMGGRNSPTRRITLGEHGRLTPMEARKEAKRILGRVALREDVAEVRSVKRRENKLASVADRYLEEYVQHQNKPSTQREAARMVESRIKPALGTIKVGDLTRARVKEWHHSMRATPYEANRALAFLSKIMSLAVNEWELILTNPCLGIRRFPERKRERFLTEDELSKLGAALHTCEAGGAISSDFAGAVRLLALTGCRLGEILDLEWRFVDADFATIRLPDAKSGARVVAVAGAGQSILRGADRTTDFVFPGLAGNKPMSRHAFHYFWKKIKQEAGLENVRPHDLRHTAGTFAAQAGFNAFHIRDFLGHRTLAMTNRYVERTADPIRTTAAAVDSRIANALDGKSRKAIRVAKARGRRVGAE